MPTIAADSRDWLTAFSASPQAVRFMNHTSADQHRDAGAAGEHAVPGHDQAARPPTTPGQNDGGRSGYGP